jgi:hypothetical protein
MIGFGERLYDTFDNRGGLNTMGRMSNGLHAIHAKAVKSDGLLNVILESFGAYSDAGAMSANKTEVQLIKSKCSKKVLLRLFSCYYFHV